jgi:hypothetical protein
MTEIIKKKIHSRGLLNILTKLAIKYNTVKRS